MRKYKGAVYFFLSSRITAVTAIGFALIYFIIFDINLVAYSSGSTVGSFLSTVYQKLLSVLFVSIMSLSGVLSSRFLFIRSDADFLFNYSIPSRVLGKCAAIYGSMISGMVIGSVGVFLRLLSLSGVPAYATLLYILLSLVSASFVTVSGMFRGNRNANIGIVVNILLNLSYLLGNPLSPAAISGGNWAFGLISQVLMLALWAVIATTSLRINSVGTLYFMGRNRRELVRSPLDFGGRKGIRSFSYFLRTLGVSTSRNSSVFRFRYRTIIFINSGITLWSCFLYLAYPSVILPYLSVIILIIIYINSFMASFAIFRLRYEKLWISWAPFKHTKETRNYILSQAWTIFLLFAPLLLYAAVFSFFPYNPESIFLFNASSTEGMAIIYLVLVMFPASLLSIFLTTIVPPEQVRDDFLTTPAIGTSLVSVIPILYVYISALVGLYYGYSLFIYSFAGLSLISILVITNRRLLGFAFKRISSSLYV